MNDYNSNQHDFQQPEPPSSEFKINWIPLAVAAMFLLSGFVNGYNWTFLLILAIVVIIHELGHVVMGRRFGCAIKEMQVFFFAFLSYKPRQVEGGGWWRQIKWSLGVLPWGGFTVFRSRKEDGDGEGDDTDTSLPDTHEFTDASPYIDDKPASQRLLISAGGVLFNIVTFAVLYAALAVMPADVWYAVCYPVAALSLILAVLNILPIYPLDGGAILFAAYEIATGHKPSEGFVRTFGTVGFVLVILLFWVFPGLVNGLVDMVMKAVF